MKIKLAGLVLLFFAMSAGAMDQLSLEETALKAQAENPQVLKSMRAAGIAQRNLKGNARLESSSISFNAAYGSSSSNSSGSSSSASSANSAAADSVLSGTSTVSIPILDQLTLGGSITAKESQELSGNATLTAKPFAAPTPVWTTETVHAKAVITWEYQRRQTYYDAETKALEYLAADMKQIQSRADFDLETRISDVMQAKLKLGEATFDELQEQLSALTDARKALYSAESAKVSTWKNLRQLFNPESEPFSPAPLPLPEMEDRIAQRSSLLTQITSEGKLRPVSALMSSLKLDLQSLGKELQATPAWRPDLSITGTLGLPDTTKSSVGLTLSFAPSDIKKDERQNIKDQRADTMADIQMEQYNLELQRQLLERGIEITRQAFEAAKVVRTQADLTLRETELLYTQGDRTVFERDKARLALQNADLECFSSAVDWYAALGEMLALFGVEGSDAQVM